MTSQQPFLNCLMRVNNADKGDAPLRLATKITTSINSDIPLRMISYK
ncbi:hypothetical protein AB1W24_13275 [Bordetella avium]|uniref:Uncharacterized protein n=1 Tax=Bordetella avium (strain 197N) TaxID=360910 RepID=Q2KWE5_BORA1|nr:hypothetical protein BAV2690 [Bordetella avium 197N]